jgi:hypothetical protein
MSSLGGRLALLAGALGILGCVDGSTTDALGPAEPTAGSGGAASAGAAAAGTAGTAPGGTAGTGAASPTQGGAGAYVDCSTFAETTASWSLVVQIKNEMSQTLHVGHDAASCEARRLFEVEDGARNVLSSLEACHTSCQAMMETGPTACPDVCAVASTVTLQPGETLRVPWDGRFGFEHTLPAQCLDGQAVASCLQARRIEAAPFTFSATAGTQRSCLEANAGCTCAPNANGGCITAGSVIGGTVYTSEYFVNLEPGEPSTSGEPPYIGILFRDGQ